MSLHVWYYPERDTLFLSDDDILSISIEVFYRMRSDVAYLKIDWKNDDCYVDFKDGYRLVYLGKL